MPTQLLHKMEELTGNTAQIIQALGYLKNEANRGDDAPLTGILDDALRHSIKHLSDTSFKQGSANDNNADNLNVENFLYKYFTGSIEGQDEFIDYILSTHDT